MAQARANKLYRTFVKGLVTEASPLTYPEDTTLDELNTVPSRKGNRQRRYGMNYSAANVSQRPYDASKAAAEFLWSAVAAKPEVSFLVVQNGSTVSFFDRSSQAFAQNKKSFEINLSSYSRSGVSFVGDTPCQFAAGKGFLFIVNKDVEPLVVTYSLATDTITVQPITILIRDFEGVYDGLANDAEPTTLSAQHFYNLMNQGWVSR